MRKSMTAIMALTLSVGFSAALGMGSVQAAEGWTKINEEWRYSDHVCYTDMKLRTYDIE